MSRPILLHNTRRIVSAVAVVAILLALTTGPAETGLHLSPKRGKSEGRRCTIAWGLLPIAANEYWEGSEGHCPYEHCGVLYSFVRDPSQPPPFGSTDGGNTWFHNVCPDPYNEDTCQGPYEGAGENFGKAFALVGADAQPVSFPANPRGGVEPDYRYDALVDGGHWHYLVDSDQWLHDVSPPPQGEFRYLLEEIIRQGGYRKTPLPKALLEPPPAYIDEWGYCWDTPEPDHCFNYPQSDRSEPYEALMSAYGTVSARLAYAMYDDGNYMDGRYAPGQRIVVAVYNGYALEAPGNDAIMLVGYFRAVIVGYGQELKHPCDGTPGDWQSYVHCIRGRVDTVYGLAETPLTLDPTPLFPPPNQAPEVPHAPIPADGASGVPLTQTLSWESLDPDGDPLTYTVAFGPYGQPPGRATAFTSTFDPGPLLSGTTYLWWITAGDCLTKTTGPVWRFRTAGLAAHAVFLPLICKPTCPP